MTKKYTEKEMVECGSCIDIGDCEHCPWLNNIKRGFNICYTENVKAYKERLSELNSDIS